MRNPPVNLGFKSLPPRFSLSTRFYRQARKIVMDLILDLGRNWYGIPHICSSHYSEGGLLSMPDPRNHLFSGYDTSPFWFLTYVSGKKFGLYPDNDIDEARAHQVLKGMLLVLEMTDSTSSRWAFVSRTTLQQAGLPSILSSPMLRITTRKKNPSPSSETSSLRGFPSNIPLAHSRSLLALTKILKAHASLWGFASSQQEEESFLWGGVCDRQQDHLRWPRGTHLT